MKSSRWPSVSIMDGFIFITGLVSVCVNGCVCCGGVVWDVRNEFNRNADAFRASDWFLLLMECFNPAERNKGAALEGRLFPQR